MKLAVLLSMTAATLVAAPLAAQTAAPQQAAPTQQAATAGPKVGATVFDPQGGTVGTIDSVANGNAVVSTGTAKIALPLTSFGTSPKGPTLALTKAQLEAEAAKASAAASAALDTLLVAGTSVVGREMSPVGTVKAADPQFVTLTSVKGGDVKLPRAAFAATPDGKLIIGMTAAEFDAAVAGSTAQPAATTAPVTTPAS